MFSFLVLIYLLSTLFYSLIILPGKRNFRLFDYLFLFLFILIIAYRPSSLPDNSYYINFYLNFNDYSFTYTSLEDLLKKELGFLFLVNVSDFLFGNNVKLFFVFIFSINFLNFLIGSKLLLKANNDSIKENYSKHEFFKNIPFLSIPFFLLYISNYGILYNLIVLRAGLTLSFLYLAITLFMSKRKALGTLVFILSLFFHQTAFLGIIVLLCTYLPSKISIKKYYILLLSLLLLYILRVDSFVSSFNFIRLFELSSDKSENIFGAYLSIERDIANYSFRILLLFLKLFVILKFTDLHGFFRKILNINIVGVLILVLGASLPAFTRVSDYFLIFSFPLFYIFLLQIKKTRTRNFLFTTFVCTEIIISLRAINIF
jgi:hypothetical protein